MTNDPDQRMLIGAEEQRLRAADVRRIRHSTEMEGGRVPDPVQDLQDAYVRGEITSDQMVERTKAWAAAYISAQKARRG